MPPQLTLIQITGRTELLGRTGDVIRLTGTGVARTLRLPSAARRRTELSQEVEYENNLTFTGSATFQEVGRIAIAGQQLEHAFASMGSGYLLGSGSATGQLAVSLSRSAGVGSAAVIWSLIDLNHPGASLIVITSTIGSTPESSKE